MRDKLKKPICCCGKSGWGLVCSGDVYLDAKVCYVSNG